MNIYQLSQEVTYGDAISNEIFAIDDILKENKFETGIYAHNITCKKIKNKVMPISMLSSILKEDDVIIYHLSIGTELTYWFKKAKCKKILIYHNITPSCYFEKYSKEMAEITRFGRQSISDLVNSVDFVLADSEYNKKELIEKGFNNVEVMPVIMNFSDYEKQPDKATIEKYSDGKKNILFVGRLAPNKRQEDVILSFEYYKKNIDKNSRLILVGSYSIHVYVERLKALPLQLELDDVIFTGHVSFNELLAYYKIADVFLCMSEHEGFCVPLLESMYFDVPIIALGKSAIPDTLGESGIVFYEKDYARIGELMRIVLNDSAVRKNIIEKQKNRLSYYNKIDLHKNIVNMISRLS